MKILRKLTAMLLAIILAVSAIPVYAADSGKFISLNVESIDENDNFTLIEETVYNVNGKIYVPINFLTKYTPYYYSSNINAFVRTNQPEKSAWGQVKIDYDKKEALLKLNIYNKKTYKLSNIYKFGEEYFLPLDEMAALLKSEVKASDKTLRIVNSGYSLADAEYAFTLLEKEDLLSFDLDEIIDDVYAGSEVAFNTLGVIDHIGSIITGFKLQNINFSSDFGTPENYYDFFEKCVTDNDSYIEVTSQQYDLIGSSASLQKDAKNIYDKTKELGSYLGIIKDFCEPLKDFSNNSTLIYNSFKFANDVNDALKQTADLYDFLFRVGSMCDDNKNMIVNFEKYCDIVESSAFANYAIGKIRNNYGDDYVENVCTKLGDELFKFAVKWGKEAVLSKVKPYKTAMKCIEMYSKKSSLDITSNKECQIMTNVYVKHMLNNYFFTFKNYSNNEKSSEKYRTAVIFYLLSCKHLYIEANEAAKEIISKEANLYEDEIQKIEEVIELFYSAVQSKKADNFESIDTLMNTNTNNLEKSKIFNNTSVKEKETSKKPSVNTDYKFVNATEEDFKKLEDSAYNFVFNEYNPNVYGLTGNDENWLEKYHPTKYYSYKEVESYEYFLSHIFFHKDGLGKYYKDVPEIDVTKTPDPLKKIYNETIKHEINDLYSGYYYKYEKAQIDWIMRNIYNIPEEIINDKTVTKISENLFYYYDGYFYQCKHTGYGGYPEEITLDNITKLPNGCYSMDFVHNDIMTDKLDVSRDKAIVGLKKINGKKYWSLFYLGKSNDAYKEILKDFS